MINCPWCSCFPRPGNDIDDLCYLFACAAWKTWSDLRDSQRLDINISEDSITDMLLLEMLRRTNRIACTRYTRWNESKSGADWHWWFVSGNRGFPMLIQAKRLYSKSGRYEALTYKKGSRYDQTNTLLRTARNRNNDWLPLFCFYNFWSSPSLPQNPLWGCSLASAQSVKDHLLLSGQRKNDIDSIFPMSVPWCNLVCPFDDSEIDFPDAVRRRVMLTLEIKDVPEIRELPPEVQQLLRRGGSNEYLSEPSERRDSLAGMVVVSDQPIEGRD